MQVGIIKNIYNVQKVYFIWYCLLIEIKEGNVGLHYAKYKYLKIYTFAYIDVYLFS